MTEVKGGGWGGREIPTGGGLATAAFRHPPRPAVPRWLLCYNHNIMSFRYHTPFWTVLLDSAKEEVTRIERPERTALVTC